MLRQIFCCRNNYLHLVAHNRFAHNFAEISSMKEELSTLEKELTEQRKTGEV